jgi:uncharacterized protein YecE (DUF72 family)
MSIRVGIGGWNFAPWRKTFYPADLPHAQELAYASRHVTTIEVNGTFYRTQTPDSFARWHDASPDEFVFALKAPRYATNRRVLAEAGPAIERFVASGIIRLGRKLGPINWQLPPTRQFDPADCAAFLRLLPPEHAGLALRHVVEVRHASFVTPDFTALARRHGVAIVVADNPAYPQIDERCAPFVYARLQCAQPEEPAGYPSPGLDQWAARARHWADGGAEVFIYFINGFKPHAPAAAQALLGRLG